MSIIQRIDNTDSSVSTSGTWVTSRLDEANGGNVIVATGGGATLAIPFEGVAITIYGYVPPAGIFEQVPTSNYFIDGIQRGRYVASPQSAAQYGVQFFRSANLPFGQHTLQIRTEASSQTIYAMDYADIAKNRSINPPVTTITTSSQTSSTTTTSSTTSGTSSTTSGTTTSGTETTSGSTSSTTTGTETSTSSGTRTSSVTGTGTGVMDPGQPSGVSPWNEDAGNPNDPLSAASNGGTKMVGGSDGIPLGALIGIIIGVIMLVVLVILFVLLRKRKKRFRPRADLTEKGIEDAPTIAHSTTGSTAYGSQVQLVASLSKSPATSESGHPYGAAPEKMRLGFESDVSVYNSHVNEAPTSTIPPSSTRRESIASSSQEALRRYRESLLPGEAPPAYDPSPVTHAQFSEDLFQLVLGRLETSRAPPRSPNP